MYQPPTTNLSDYEVSPIPIHDFIPEYSAVSYYINEYGYLENFINYDRFKCFDPRLFGSDPNSNSSMRRLAEKIFPVLPFRSNKKAAEKLQALENILCNLAQGIKPKQLIAVDRNANRYPPVKTYGLKHYTYNIITEIIDLLEEKGFLVTKAGYYGFEDAQSRKSRIWASEKLVEMITEGNYSIQSSKRSYPNGIQLKDTERNLIGYQDNKSTKSMRAFLRKYNAFMSKQKVEYCIQPDDKKKNFDFSSRNKSLENNADSNNPSVYSTGVRSKAALSGAGRGIAILFTNKKSRSNPDNSLYYKELTTDLYRVFSKEKFSLGGRFYGAEYQGIKKDKRKTILINGNPTVELDYSAYHITMLYHMQNLPVEGYPYDLIAENALVKQVKMAINTAINSKGINSTITSIRNKLDGLVVKYDGPKTYVELDVELREKNAPLKKDLEMVLGREKPIHRLLEIIFEAHPAIEKYLCSGIGLTLQNTDSMIAEKIMKRLLAKKIPVLCIHDSFIVETQYEDELRDAMNEEYSKAMNGFKCKIKKK